MRRRDERGSITPFVVIVALAIILLAGLVIDGGRQLNAKGRAVAYAQEAARAGAQAVDVSDPRLDLNRAQALDTAQEYCRQAMAADGQLVRCEPSLRTVDDGQLGSFLAVQVDAQVEIEAILLDMVRSPTMTASGAAMARPVSGISEADSGKVSTLDPPSVAPPEEDTPATGSLPTDIEVTPCEPSPSPSPTPTDDEDDEDKDKDKDKDDKDKGDDPDDEKTPSPSPSPTPTVDYCKTPGPGGE